MVWMYVRHISGTRARIINLMIISLDKSFQAFQSRLAEGLGIDIHMKASRGPRDRHTHEG